VCSLIALLAESYLRLGQAYQKEGKVGRAVRAAEIACLLVGGLPLAEPPQQDSGKTTNALARDSKNTSKGKAGAASQKSQKGCRSCGASGEGEARPGPRCAGGSPPACQGWGELLGQTWMLAGESFVELSRLASEGASAAPDGLGEDQVTWHLVIRPTRTGPGRGQATLAPGDQARRGWSWREDKCTW